MRPGLLETVRHLAVEIGPRPSAGPQEGAAARYVAGRLQAAGCETRIETFDGLRSFSFTYGLIYAAFVAAAALAALEPAGALVLAASALAAMLLENGGREVVSRRLPHQPSRNVVAVKAPGDEARRRVVLVCHLDSANAALLWHPRLVAGFRASFLAMLGAMAGVTLLAGGLVVVPAARAYLLPPLWLCGAYLLGCVLVLAHRQWEMPVVAGANDDASGVAVALAAAEEAHLEHTELWVVATGCEESGLIGMARFCEAHDFDREVTLFLNLDNCGAGRLALTTAEGMIRCFRCDPELLALAARAAEREPALAVGARPFHAMHNDSFVLLRRGCRAASLMAFDERGVLPNWHWPTDTPEQIEPETLAHAAELVSRILREIDGG